MSNLSWGTRAENVEKTPASSGRFRAWFTNSVENALKRIRPFARAVFDHELEATGRAQAPDRRRLDHHHRGIANLRGKLLLDRRRETDGPQLGCRPVLPFLQRQEDDSAVALIGRGDHVEAFKHDGVLYSVAPRGTGPRLA